jgi:hypothetical protein
MKITKKQLKQIIKEELALFEINGQEEVVPEPEEEEEKLSREKARVAGIEQGKAAGTAGITDAERGVMRNILGKLQTAAADGNIMTGKPFLLMQKLAAALVELIGD